MAQQISDAVPPALRTVTVDAAKSLGPMKALRGVNSGPLPWSDRPAVERLSDEVEVSDRTGYRSLGADASAGYRQANVDLVRIHDNYGTGDIYANFQGTRLMADGTVVPASSLNALVMFPNLAADPSHPANYNFGPTDRLMKSIYDIGGRALFRIGASAGERSGVPNAFTTESDFEHYADIARHVVLHYNKGWNQGFHYNVKYWEVLNEPDGRFDPLKYYKLYGKLAAAVKSADRDALIGGPALMFTHNGPDYRESFLKYLRANRLPLDFWTFHDYNVDAADPYLYVRLGEDMRKLLDSHGFQKTSIIMSEWNVLGINPELLTLGGRAAFTASAIIYMQDSPIDDQTFYMAPNLFGEDGKTSNKMGQALIVLGKMKDTPIRLSVQGADTYGFAVQAGKSADGQAINIIISNYEVPASLRGPRPTGDRIEGGGYAINLLPRRAITYERNDGFDLRVTGLEANKLYRVERYRISDVWDYRLLSTVTVKGSALKISQILAPPSIELVSISVSSSQ
ncbi:hypothetical protein [Sphingomonas sp. DBB INV C78]|uniref:GH39 family glycosyl hydrolase n=1 Tax=Sphingomonas sp. DBB INV C78 TaxID=3349434 RepID=UPI0036D3EB51